MDLVSLSGLMVGDIRVTGLMIRNKARALLYGLMGSLIRDNGRMGSSMGKEAILMHKVRQREVSGVTEKE